jgi:7,8-dihydroneopterin aldolase/epimerase/oxygenase
MDKISLNQMTFFGCHGVFPGEKQKPQPFIIDVIMYLDLYEVSRTDHLSESIDYNQVYENVKHVVEDHSYYLIERIAGEIAEIILNRYDKIVKVTVRLQKKYVEAFSGNGTPEVELSRTQKK